jgi:hypothetical protein
LGLECYKVRVGGRWVSEAGAIYLPGQSLYFIEISVTMCRWLHLISFRVQVACRESDTDYIHIYAVGRARRPAVVAQKCQLQTNSLIQKTRRTVAGGIKVKRRPVAPLAPALPQVCDARPWLPILITSEYTCRYHSNDGQILHTNEAPTTTAANGQSTLYIG